MFTAGLPALSEETFVDEAVDIRASGGGSEAELAGELHARQIFMRADAAKHLGFEVRHGRVLDLGRANERPFSRDCLFSAYSHWKIDERRRRAVRTGKLSSGQAGSTYFGLGKT